MRDGGPIAIVGMGVVAPGATEVDAFWRNLAEGRDLCRDAPPGRWTLPPDVARAKRPGAAGPDEVVSTRGYFVDPFSVDPAGLAVDPGLLARLDPVYHFVLHAGRRAFEAGVTAGVDRSRVGVILAAIALPTAGSSAISRAVVGGEFERGLFALARDAGGAGAGSSGDSDVGRDWCAWNAQVTALPAAILARALGLGGGSYTLDAACASSLYALKLACDELRAGRADAMLAGGVSRPDCLYTQMGFSQLRSLSPSGRCAPFDARADGLVVGEGAGVVLLKRMDDALSAGDRVLGVIRGIGLSNDIGGSLIAPDSEGQLRAMRQAYEYAGWRPEDVDYIECHGTGTPLGDAVEVASLRALWGESDAPTGVCAIGSVKSSVGHLLTAAGAAGLIKTLLAMNVGTIPPALNFERAGETMGLAGSPFRVQTAAGAWPARAGGPRRAAVSAFGFGGINAHVLVEAWEGGSRKPKAESRKGRGDGSDNRGLNVETSKRQNVKIEDGGPVAIVGMDARFGAVTGLRAFQEWVLGNAKNVELRIEKSELGEERRASGVGIGNSRIERLSVGVGEFRVPPNELPEILPQQLLAMQSVAAAMRDAGLAGRAKRPRVGAVMGIALDLATNDFDLRWWLPAQARAWAARLGWELTDDEMAAWVARLRAAIGPPLTAARTLGALGGTIASRIAREFGLGGPCFAVSADVASGLRALEGGVRALQRGELDAVVVGAVDLATDPRKTACDLRFAACDGRGDPGRGSVFGDGAGAVVLKRLADARAAGDRVYAVVRGIGAASGGVTCDLRLAACDSPRPASSGIDPWPFEEARRRALADAAVLATDVDYWETDAATAAQVGDAGAATGMAALVKAATCVYQQVLPTAGGVWAGDGGGAHAGEEATGAVFWHRDRAAGPRRAGVSTAAVDGNAVCVILEEGADENQPRVEMERRRPLGALPAALFVMRGEGEAGLRAAVDELERMARSVSAGEMGGGAGGGSGLGDRRDAEASRLNGVSARGEAARVETARGAAAAVERLARAWFSAERDRLVREKARRGARTAAIVAESVEGLIARIAMLRRRMAGDVGGIAEDVYYSGRQNSEGSRSGELAFVYPGSGSHYAGMGCEVGTAWPEVVREFNQRSARGASQMAAELFTPRGMGMAGAGGDDARGGRRDAEASRLNGAVGGDARRQGADAARVGVAGSAAEAILADPVGMIFGQVSHGAAMTDLLGRFGARPGAAIGYSLGESAALVALGAWPDRDELYNRLRASPLFATDLAGPCDAVRRAWRVPAERSARWKAVVLPREPGAVRAALAEHHDVRLLIVNTPGECVVGGLAEAVDAFLAATRWRAVPLAGVPSVHCEVAREVEAAYLALHDLPTTPPAGVRFYSAAAGKAYAVTRRAAAESITAQAIAGFDFPALIRQAYDDGVRVFVEVGPGNSCTRMIGRILGDRPHRALAADGRGAGGAAAVLRLIAALAAEGVPVDLTALYGVETRVCYGADEAPGAGERIVVLAHRVPGAAVLPERMEREMRGRGGAGGGAVGNAWATDVRAGTAKRQAVSDRDGEEENDARDSAKRQAAGGGVGAAGGVQEVGRGFPVLNTSVASDARAMQGEAGEEARGVLGEIAVEVARTAEATGRAHAAYLQFAQAATAAMGEALIAQAEWVGGAENGEWRMANGELKAESRKQKAEIHELQGEEERLPNGGADTEGPFDGRRCGPDDAGGIQNNVVLMREKNVVFTRAQCLEFAVGSAAKVLGPAFAAVDGYPVRVRLPDEPLMLVDRITALEGEAGSLSRGRLVTEHDVKPGAWYLDGGRAPVCITVEAGQADLFLSGYLGIDLAVKGTRSYRLLDATVTFHRGLPRPGETIQYDIRIDRFVRRGETYLFFFEFDGTIDGRPMLTMRSGCAGFFTAEEVAAAGGVVLRAEDTAPGEGKRAAEPFVPMRREAYDDARLQALRRGDLAGCFGEAFAGLPLAAPARLPDGRMKLLDRVVELDPTGGRFGLGLIRAELDIHPNDWFLTCHFVDDMVMPGTLMYECCVHTLRVLLMRMGWVCEETEVAYEPIAGVASGLKCRGPVTPRTQKVTYEVAIKEIGYRPEPYVIADALMYADGARVVQMTNMSLQLTGLSRARLEAIWAGREAKAESRKQKSESQNVETSKRQNEEEDDRNETLTTDHWSLATSSARPAVYDYDRILAFAIGRPSEAFGEPYRVFDERRRIARLPGPPFQFLDRIVTVEPAPWELKPGGWIEAEYDVPVDAWYFRANRQASMPFAVLLEAALQPCGWLAAYLGSALRSEQDLKFRNLGGTATLHEEIFPGSGTLATRVRMTKVSEAGGMIIQEFEFQMTREGRPVYDGVTQFGFFTEAALAKQVGIRDAAGRWYAPGGAESAGARGFEIPKVGSAQPADWGSAKREAGMGGSGAGRGDWRNPARVAGAAGEARGLVMPGRAFRMVERVDALRLDGGPQGLGFVLGSAAVDPAAWFFQAHFYQDPVWPGSLGLESLLQLMKAYAIERWGARLGATHRFEPIAVGRAHTWTYRGQIIPTNRRVEVSAVITRVEEGESPVVVADGLLRVDGTIIYEMKDFALRVVGEAGVGG